MQPNAFQQPRRDASRHIPSFAVEREPRLIKTLTKSGLLRDVWPGIPVEEFQPA
jgi:hypothetical protein